MTQRLPVLFLGHGSPMTVITDGPDRRALQALGRRLDTPAWRPRAILTISAHWETGGATHLTAQLAPPTIHDFRGFPPELYAIHYPARGSAELVARVQQALAPQRVVADDEWGYDHGTWGVVQPMFPAADIPVVAMSLDRQLGAAQHVALGRALAPLRDEGVLIIASGNIIHNLKYWRQYAGTVPDWAADFGQRINAALVEGEETHLTHFAAEDEGAALAINSAEHYLPLLYAAGARLSGDEVRFFNDRIDGALSMTSVVFGDPALTAGLDAQAREPAEA